jgi:hypothetical protein
LKHYIGEGENFLGSDFLYKKEELKWQIFWELKRKEPRRNRPGIATGVILYKFM